MTTRALLMVAVLGLVVPGGCSGGANSPTEVTGTVTLDGQPLQVGLVMLATENGETTRAGELRPDGTFRVPEFPQGKAVAAVKTTPFAYMAQVAGKDKGGRPVSMRLPEGKFVPVPPRYEDPKTSQLSYEVKKGQPLHIKLTSR